MKFTKTEFKDLLVIEPIVHRDSRGYFFESYHKQGLEAADIYCSFVQDNEAFSRYGAIRGFHYQLPPYEQDKLVRVIEGEVLDAVVDIRPYSPSYGQGFSIILSAENKKQLFVPAGFAHAYATLSETAIFSYKCSQYYSLEHEAGIDSNDPALNIDWKIPKAERLISEKDSSLPKFGDHLLWPEN